MKRIVVYMYGFATSRNKWKKSRITSDYYLQRILSMVKIAFSRPLDPVGATNPTDCEDHGQQFKFEVPVMVHTSGYASCPAPISKEELMNYKP